jgi:F-type H+-transporting ATPase subunit a
MNKWIKILLIAVVLIGLSYASTKMEDVHLGGHHEGAWPDGDHWSIIAAVFPGLVHNVYGLIDGQKTFIAGETPNRIIHVFMGLIVFALALGGGIVVWKRLKKDPPIIPDRKLTVFGIMEGIASVVYGLMEGLMGEENARKYFPLIASLAVFILFSNLLGMIPGLLPPTDTLNTTLALGSVVFVSTHYFGVRAHGISYFKHFLGPIIKWYALPLMLLMLVIEIISHLVRPISLAVRLMGNIMGDHKVLGIFLGFGVLFVPLPIMVLGLMVALVQTLVFCLLSVTYIALAVEEEEGH